MGCSIKVVYKHVCVYVWMYIFCDDRLANFSNARIFCSGMKFLFSFYDSLQNEVQAENRSSVPGFLLNPCPGKRACWGDVWVCF